VSLWLRILRIMVATWLGRRSGLLDPVTLSYRVWPWDLDPNMHMTNTRYYEVMDVGRIEFLFLTRLLPQMVKRKWGPALGSIGVRYRRSLRPFQRYRVVTRLACWDDKWLYFEQAVESGGETYALAMSRLAVVGAGGPVAIGEALGLVGHDGASPAAPPSVGALDGLSRTLSPGQAGQLGEAGA
jgi:acyl-CoA thioesterase FadM